MVTYLNPSEYYVRYHYLWKSCGYDELEKLLQWKKRFVVTGMVLSSFIEDQKFLIIALIKLNHTHFPTILR